MFMSEPVVACRTLAPGQMAFASVHRNRASALPSARLAARVAGVATPATGMGPRSTGQCRPDDVQDDAAFAVAEHERRGRVDLDPRRWVAFQAVGAGRDHGEVERRARVVHVARRAQAQPAGDGQHQPEAVGDVDLGRHVAAGVLDGDGELGARQSVGDAAQVDDVLPAGRPELRRPVVQHLRHLDAHAGVLLAVRVRACAVRRDGRDRRTCRPGPEPPRPWRPAAAPRRSGPWTWRRRAPGCFRQPAFSTRTPMFARILRDCAWMRSSDSPAEQIDPLGGHLSRPRPRGRERASRRSTISAITSSSIGVERFMLPRGAM